MYKITVLFALFFLAAAETQSQEKKEEKADSTYKTYSLEGITVTATRLPEFAMEVPMAVNIIGRDAMENARGYGLDEALSFIPGVLAQSRTGNQDIRLAIRGFGARGAGDRSNAGTTRGVRVLLNGIPQTEPDGRTSFDLIDPNLIQRMEVVRSNSSAIWGNAGGGIVSISTLPANEGTYARAQYKAGSFGLSESSVLFGTNIKSTKLYGTFTSTSFDGWRYNSSSERTLATFGLESKFSDRTTLNFYAAFTRNNFNIPGALTQAHFDTAAKDANAKYAIQKEHRTNKVGLMGLSVDHAFTEDNGFSGMIYVNPKYLQRSERNTFRDFTRYHFGGNAMYRQNWNISEINNTTLIGADGAYQDGAILFYNLLKQDSTGRRGSTLRNNKREGARNLGYFVQNESKLTKKLSVTLGLRLDAVTYYNENYAVNVPGSDTVNTQLGLQHKTFSSVIPKAGVSYLLTDEHTIYASFGGGIEVPAGNETDPSNVNGDDAHYVINPLLDPVKSTTFELGTKHNAVYAEDNFVKYLYYDVALYWIQVKNDLIPYRDGVFYFTAGETRRRGIEFAGNTAVAYGISAKASLTYSDNKYVKYQVDSINASFPGGNYKNNKVAGLPDVYYGASVRYTARPFVNAFIELGVQGLGKYFADDANTMTVSPYKIFNLSAGLAEPMKLGRGVTLKIFGGVNNLLDRKYASSSFINPLKESGTNLPMYLEPGLPRNFYASLVLGWN